MTIAFICMFAMVLVLIYGIFTEIKAYRNGTQALILYQLIQKYTFYVYERKRIYLSVLDSCLGLIEQYEKLGGKSDLSYMKEALLKLPNDPI